MDDRTRQLMKGLQQEIAKRLRSGALVAAQRRRLLSELSDGEPHWTAELVNAAAPQYAQRGMRLTLAIGRDPDVSDLVEGLARRAAAIEALGVMYSAGIVLEVSPQKAAGVSGGTSPGVNSLDYQFEVTWSSSMQSSTGPANLFIPMPTSPNRVRLTHPPAADGTALDYVSYAAALAPLALDERTLRALQEAFRAARAGLYLSNAVLCGTVVEGAVRSLAPLLEGLAGSHADELTNEKLRTTTKRMLVVLAETKQKELSSRVQQISANLHRFIDLRNYGAHTGDPDAGLERWFSDEYQAAMLLADVRHTLLELHDAIADRIAVAQPAVSSG